jgi:hypothetical protein
MNGLLCRDCGHDHQTGAEALDCTTALADRCGCGHCWNCRTAVWWRTHPRHP